MSMSKLLDFSQQGFLDLTHLSKGDVIQIFKIWWFNLSGETMGADALATYISRSSTAMALITCNTCVLFFYEEGLQLTAPSGCWERAENEIKINHVSWMIVRILSGKGQSSGIPGIWWAQSDPLMRFVTSVTAQSQSHQWITLAGKCFKKYVSKSMISK